MLTDIPVEIEVNIMQSLLVSIAMKFKITKMMIILLNGTVPSLYLISDAKIKS